jgi:hypothetical protein
VPNFGKKPVALCHNHEPTHNFFRCAFLLSTNEATSWSIFAMAAATDRVAGLLNAQFNAWDGTGLPPRGITQAGLLVRATTSTNPPGKNGVMLTNHTQWRKWVIARNAMHAVRTRADGLSPDETPRSVALTLLNRGACSPHRAQRGCV